MLPQPKQPEAARTALFDPQRETGKQLEALGLKCQPVEAGTPLSGFDLLAIGKGALTPEGAAPNLTAVREGLKITCRFPARAKEAAPKTNRVARMAKPGHG